MHVSPTSCMIDFRMLLLNTSRYTGWFRKIPQH